MLTKRTKEQAEQIRQELAPICGDIIKLAKKYTKAGREHGAAYKIKIAWQTVGNSGHALDVYTSEEVANMEEMRRNDPKQWAANYHNAVKEEKEKEKALKVARINLKNMLSFAALVVCSRVDLDDLKDHEARSLAEFLTIGNAGDPFRVLFSFNSYNQEIEANSLNVWGKKWEAQGKEKPQPLTVAKYDATIKKLKAIKEKAEKLQDESRAIVRASGLWGFVSFIIQVKESL